MSLLIPLGLLGLLGIVVLIIIYVIKPNYQNKFVSSTFVWKLSLKFKKRKLPTSKLKNILLIICQVLILALIALLLAKPVHYFVTGEKGAEVIAIIDSSSSMRTEDDGETRYERAISKAKALGIATINDNGLFSIITGSNNPSYLLERSNETNAVIDKLDSLVDNGVLACTYGPSNVEESFRLCDSILMDNPNTKIVLYTDTTYGYVPKNVEVVNVANEEEWNVAILDAYAELNDNYYDVVVEIASYGKSTKVGIDVMVDGANAEDKDSDGITIHFKPEDAEVFCEDGQIKKVIFKGSNVDELDDENIQYIPASEQRFYSYKTISVTLSESDSYTQDNSFQIYGGQKEVIKVQYSSTNPNTFISSVFFVLRSYYADKYDIQVTEEKKGNPQLSGYDYYIFEHQCPAELPTDGVVLLLDPTNEPKNAGFRIRGNVDYIGQKEMFLVAEDDTHPLLKNIGTNEITVSYVTRLESQDDSYKVLASCNNDPMLMVKNEGRSKVFLMNFSLHYSNIAITTNLPLLFNNILNYFTPSTVESNACEVNETVPLIARGQELTVKNDDKEVVYKDFPASFVAEAPGTYIISQTTDYDDEIVDYVYVRSPRAESNIFAVEDALPEPYQNDVVISLYDDLVFWFALALVALVLAEWWLKGRESA